MTRRRLILVTGGSGFVGRHVVQALVERGHAVVATHADPPHKAPRDGVRLRWTRWDGTRDALPGVDWRRVEAVIHLAIPGSLFEFPANAEALFSLEVASTFRLLEAARLNGVRRFVTASTGYALGLRSEPHEETDCSYQPDTFYGTTKACAELLTRGYAPLLSTATVRFYWPYGPGGDRYVVQRLLHAVSEGRDVYVEGRNGMLLNPIWVGDLARGVALAAESDQRGVFHLAGPETVSMRELIQRMGRLLGRKPVIRVRPKGPNACQAACWRRTARALNFRPTVSLDEGLSRLLATLNTKEATT